jgi:hypothetical protein
MEFYHLDAKPVLLGPDLSKAPITRRKLSALMSGACDALPMNFIWLPVRRGDLQWGLLSLVKVCEEGDVGRIRRCSKCSKWFYARFRHKKFCSANCQQSHYRSSEEWKAHRRRWMRRYRAIKQLPNVK